MCDAYETALAEMNKETPDLDSAMSLLIQSLEFFMRTKIVIINFPKRLYYLLED